MPAKHAGRGLVHTAAAQDAADAAQRRAREAVRVCVQRLCKRRPRGRNAADAADSERSATARAEAPLGEGRGYGASKPRTAGYLQNWWDFWDL